MSKSTIKSSSSTTDLHTFDYWPRRPVRIYSRSVSKINVIKVFCRECLVITKCWGKIQDRVMIEAKSDYAPIYKLCEIRACDYFRNRVLTKVKNSNPYCVFAGEGRKSIDLYLDDYF